ncbi:MAG: glycosyltransferase family 4 protein [Rudaea sp.]|uniref:glycosyltransferase family 4 protein n=1 Tax=Rudaea sp. TaxID=2136325 RepID=UPI0039E24C9E
MAKILVLTSRVCYPPREGHQLRTWHLLRALAREHEIHLLSFARADDATDEAAPLRALVASMQTFPIPSERSRFALAAGLVAATAASTPFVVKKYTSPALRAHAARLARTADLIHVDMLPLMSAVVDIDARVPLVLNAHNVEHELLRQRAEVETRALHRTFLRSQVGKLRDYEIAACRRARLVLTCSQIDANHLSSEGISQTRVVPNGIDTQFNRPDPRPGARPARLVFVGQMGWFPNADGMRWFLDDVFPRILAQRPETELVVVGKSGGLEVPAGVAHRVRLAGFVDDVRAAVTEAGVYIVPLRAGSGTRLKVLEAMALGMPIVTTRVGAEGIDLEHGRNALFAESADAFADAVLELLAAPDKARHLGDAAHALAVARYDWEAIGAELLRDYRELLAPASAEARARQR